MYGSPDEKEEYKLTKEEEENVPKFTSYATVKSNLPEKVQIIKYDPLICKAMAVIAKQAKDRSNNTKRKHCMPFFQKNNFQQRRQMRTPKTNMEALPVHARSSVQFQN